MIKKLLKVTLVYLLSLAFYACSVGTVSTEQTVATDDSAGTTTVPSAIEMDSMEVETTKAAPMKYLTIADLDGLDGKAALALLEENGLELGEYYAAKESEAADAVAQILLDLEAGRTDPEMLYSKTALKELHKTIKAMLGVPDRLQLYNIQELVGEKAAKLSWNDFAQYQYEDTGSGSYIREYPVGTENEYVLILRGKDLSSAPEEISLFLLKDGVLDREKDEHIDIRYEDLEKLLRETGA